MARPQEIYRNAKQDDDQARPRVLRLVEQQDYINKQRHHNVDGGQPWIAEGAVGTRSVGTGAAQNEEAHQREHVEDEHGKDGVVEQLAVASAEAQDAGPDGLHDERKMGSAVARMQARLRMEEESVAGHGVVDARASENESVVAAEGRDQDRKGHQFRAALSHDLLHDGGGHAVFRGVLDSAPDGGDGVRLAPKWQHQQVDEIDGNVEEDDRAGSDGERERQVALRVADLSGGKGDVVPGIGGE